MGVDDAEVLCVGALRVRASTLPRNQKKQPCSGSEQGRRHYEDSSLEVELDGGLEDAWAFAGGGRDLTEGAGAGGGRRRAEVGVLRKLKASKRSCSTIASWIAKLRLGKRPSGCSWGRGMRYG